MNHVEQSGWWTRWGERWVAVGWSFDPRALYVGASWERWPAALEVRVQFVPALAVVFYTSWRPKPRVSATEHLRERPAREKARCSRCCGKFLLDVKTNLALEEVRLTGSDPYRSPILCDRCFVEGGRTLGRR